MLASATAGIGGQNASTPARPTADRAATSTNVARQPYACPTSVPIGSPITVASAKPLKTRATAAVCFSGATAAIATWDATAMNRACASAEPIRPIIKRVYE